MTAELARTIIDANSYLTLGTADADGRPWATPVWFAADRYTDFIWVSRPGTRHSRNIAVRPDVGIVVFDSTVPIGQGQAVYVEAVAGQVPESEVEVAIAVFSARSVTDGGRTWQAAEVVGGAQFRLYRARATAHYVLDDHDSRVPVALG
ncbi:pyridoxamine 5'-phosphate oxidase family protein [Asanoa sp. NPDC050611]|uniref:pyridoxamine 5'-phosphate oxidase family protein n=1 Tax=Asanoa sp. NPDC050611 TaxID=3157098 RepID=UPI0033DF7D80